MVRRQFSGRCHAMYRRTKEQPFHKPIDLSFYLTPNHVKRVYAPSKSCFIRGYTNFMYVMPASVNLAKDEYYSSEG